MSSPPKPWGWEDYYIPSTLGNKSPTLRNKFTSPGNPYGEPNPLKLEKKERSRTLRRMAELRMQPIKGKFDYAHMKAIHRHLFQDVYEWAGEERTAPPRGWAMTKEDKFGKKHAYGQTGPEMAYDANQQYDLIKKANYLREMGRTDFVKELGARWGALNTIHSFREGNTRSQFVFFEQLCRQAGWRLDVEAFAPGQPLRDEFVAARFHAQDTGQTDKLSAVLDKGITPLPPPTSRAGRGGPTPGIDPVRDSFPHLPGTPGPTMPQTPNRPSQFRGRGYGPQHGGLSR